MTATTGASRRSVRNPLPVAELFLVIALVAVVVSVLVAFSLRPRVVLPTGVASTSIYKIEQQAADGRLNHLAFAVSDVAFGSLFASDERYYVIAETVDGEVQVATLFTKERAIGETIVLAHRDLIDGAEHLVNYLPAMEGEGQRGALIYPDGTGR